MTTEEIDELVRKGIEAAEKGYIHSAEVLLAQAREHRNTPELHSYQAYCIARGHGRLQHAAKICQESIKRDPGNSLHYLILGKILLMAGDRKKAVDAYRRGLKTGPSPRIIAELKKLGLRKPAVIAGLDRSHPVNRILGKLFSRIGLR